MTPKFLRKKLRVYRRRLRNQRIPLIAGGALLVLTIVGYAIHMDTQRPTVNPAAYKPLLDVIARAESNDNYNAYYGNPGNKDVHFTNMSVAEVMAWQNVFIAQGNASSAVGRYQIINTTLAGLVRQMGIDTSQKFDAAMQDRMAIALLERRGSLSYAAQQLAPQEFAANIAKEWAGLPRVLGGDPNASYYAGDGLNASRANVDEVMKAIEPITTE